MLNGVDHRSNIGHGREVAPGKTQRAILLPLWQTHGTENVAAGISLRRTGGAVRYGHQIMPGFKRSLGIYAGNRQVYYVRHGAPGVAVDHSPQRLEAIEQPAAKVTIVRRPGFAFFRGQLSRLSQSGDQMDRLSAGSPAALLPST